MAAQNQPGGSFDPSREIDGYLVNDADTLRQRGLQKQSIRFYEMLCRLCLPGQSQLVYRQQADLVKELGRLFPDDGGLTEGSISRKLRTLTSLGFAAKYGGGQSHCPLIIELFMPDQVELKPPRSRIPSVAVTPSEERQRQLFDGGGQYRLVGCDEDPSKAQTLALSKAQTLSVSPPESANACAFESPSAEQHTSYTRVPGVETIVEDESTGTRTSMEMVSEEELAEAKHAWLATIDRWRAKRGIASLDRKSQATNVAAFLKAHVLLQRGQLSEQRFTEAANAPIMAAKIAKGPFALVWTEWKRDKQFKRKIAKLQLPANWSVGLSRAERAPNGEEPQRE